MLSVPYTVCRTGGSDGFLLNVLGGCLRLAQPFTAGWLDLYRPGGGGDPTALPAAAAGGAPRKFADLFERHLRPGYYASQKHRVGDLSGAVNLTGEGAGRRKGVAGRGAATRRHAVGARAPLDGRSLYLLCRRGLHSCDMLRRLLRAMVGAPSLCRPECPVLSAPMRPGSRGAGGFTTDDDPPTSQPPLLLQVRAKCPARCTPAGGASLITPAHRTTMPTRPALPSLRPYPPTFSPVPLRFHFIPQGRGGGRRRRPQLHG